MSLSPLLPGEPAPWFIAPSSRGNQFHFSSLGGRYVALLFFGSASVSSGPVQAALARVRAHRAMFTSPKACFFGLSANASDRDAIMTAPEEPGINFFWDPEGHVSQRYGALPTPGAQQEAERQYHPFWLVMDPLLRVMARFALHETDQALDFVARLPPIDLHAGMEIPAPVLVLPRVFEPKFCAELIAHYKNSTPVDSGFMRDVGGKTVGILDPNFKRRYDVEVDGALREGAKRRIERRLLPQIQKAFQFQATRIERFMVACYDGERGGFFARHRDNTTKATAHRRFAVTINLNAEDFTGGELCFPEFGSRTYRAPTGGAVVFSCSLLHEALPVKSGTRYAFLPFLYDEKGQEIWEEGQQYLANSA
jgi:predicted 2-oxoglutarate/Fe(II)-dependent dioxygenase YbiX/peroxiredoxin